MKRPEQVDVTFKIETTFKVQESRHLTFLVDAFDVRSCERQLDHRMIFFDLVQCKIYYTEGIFCLKSSGVVIFGSIHREEHGVYTAFFGPWKIDVAISVTVTDIRFHQKLAGHHVSVSVHHECFAMEVGHRLTWRIVSSDRRGQQRLYWKNATGY